MTKSRTIKIVLFSVASILLLLIGFQNCAKGMRSSDYNKLPSPQSGTQSETQPQSIDNNTPPLETFEKSETNTPFRSVASCQVLNVDSNQNKTGVVCVDYESATLVEECQASLVHFINSGGKEYLFNNDQAGYRLLSCTNQRHASVPIGNCLLGSDSKRQVIHYYALHWTIDKAKKDCTDRASSEKPVWMSAAEGETKKIIYLTSKNYLPTDFGSPQGADEKCMNDPARPPSVMSAKALIADETKRRQSDYSYGPDLSTSIDWALGPNTTYFHPDGISVFGTTNAGAIMTSWHEGVLGEYWSGLGASWNSAVSSTNCNDWSSSAADVTGEVAVLPAAWAAVNFPSLRKAPCNEPAALVCVAQASNNSSSGVSIPAPSELAGELNIASSTPESYSVTLSWKNNADRAGRATIIEYSRGQSQSVPPPESFEILTTVNSLDSSYVDGRVTPGQYFHYRVYSINSQGQSSYSNVVSVAVGTVH
ncbi:MAG: DUF1554 domain-containing protein [Pseudobdellovibrionaceae bacterium]